MEIEIAEWQHKKLMHAADITSIQMLMGRYVDRLSRMDVSSVFEDMFVTGSDDVSIELFECGEYRGEDHVRVFLRAYDEYLSDPSDKRGWMEHQLLCTPYVKISTDGRRGLGTWSLFCPSAKMATPYPCDSHRLTPMWVSGKYFCEFRKVCGSWKFLKLRVLSYLRSPFEIGWTKQADCYSMPVFCGIKPDGSPRGYLYNFDYGMGNGGVEWGPYLPEDAGFE